MYKQIRKSTRKHSWSTDIHQLCFLKLGIFLNPEQHQYLSNVIIFSCAQTHTHTKVHDYRLLSFSSNINNKARVIKIEPLKIIFWGVSEKMILIL